MRNALGLTLRLGVIAGAVLLLLCAFGRAAFADPAFAVKIEAPPAKKAQKSVARIHLKPGAGFHMNKEYPTSVTVVAPVGVTVDKARQTAQDAVKFEEAAADFEVAFTAADAGKKTFTGELKFAVCSASSCDPKKEKISFTVDVN